MNSGTLSKIFGLPSDFNASTVEGLKSLKEYHFLVEQAVQAALAFLAQDLAKFDPNVGDCSCQVRSVKTALLARDCNVIAEMENLMNQAMCTAEACKDLLNGASSNKKVQASNVMQGLLPDLIVRVSKDVAYLVQAYFVMLMQKSLPAENNQSPNMKINFLFSQLTALSGGRVSSNRAGVICSILRRNLSLASLRFIRRQAEISQNPILMKACSKPYTQQSRLRCSGVEMTLYSVPMFYSCQILMETCRREGITVVFKVKQYTKDLLNSKQLDTEYVRLGSVEARGPSLCVFEGVRQDTAENLSTRSRLCNNTLAVAGERVIFAGAADHPQYAKEGGVNNLNELEKAVPDSFRLEQFAARAQAVGCSIKNPSLFFIQHVYPQSERFLLEEGCPAAVLGISEEGVINV